MYTAVLSCVLTYGCYTVVLSCVLSYGCYAVVLSCVLSYGCYAVVLALLESDNAAEWQSKLIVGDTLGVIGQIKHADVTLNLDGDTPTRRQPPSLPAALTQLILCCSLSA